MKTSPELPGRAPDIMVIAKRNFSRLRPMFLDGPADVVVEIDGPESTLVNIVRKFEEYEQGGVREFWLIDPVRRRAEFYRRGYDGRFRLHPIGPDAVYRSLVMKGFWLNVEWLWERPPVTAIVKAWGIM